MNINLYSALNCMSFNLPGVILISIHKWNEVIKENNDETEIDVLCDLKQTEMCYWRAVVLARASRVWVKVTCGIVIIIRRRRIRICLIYRAPFKTEGRFTTWAGT